MQDAVLKVMIPGFMLAIGGVAGLALQYESKVMAKDFVAPPVTANTIEITKVEFTATSVRAALELPYAPEATNAPLMLASPSRSGSTLHTADAANPCDMQLKATPLAAGIVNVSVTAPCAPDSRIVVTQGEMSVTFRTDADGGRSFDFPLLSSPASITVALADGASKTVQATMPDLGDYARYAVQWRGDTGMMLHAFEQGADYDTPGHVHPYASNTIAHVLSGNGGYLQVIGDAGADDAMIAQVYTVPLTSDREPLDVSLSIEAEVTDATCGQDMTARTFEVNPSKPLSSFDLDFAVPECDAVGELIILNDLFRPVAVASN